MEHQLTFVDSEFSSKRRQTRKEIFLFRMDAFITVVDSVSTHRTGLSKSWKCSSTLSVANDVSAPLFTALV